MVHRPQFNGKQEGAFNRPPNLRCPRNGKRTNHLLKNRFCFHQDHWAHAKHAAGKVMEGAPPARIPANTVASRAFQGKRSLVTHMLAGKPARVVC
mgnify:CR=1 FL=1